MSGIFEIHLTDLRVLWKELTVQTPVTSHNSGIPVHPQCGN